MRKNKHRPTSGRPVLCKGATLQLNYGVGRGFGSGLGTGLIGLPESGGGTSMGSRNGTSRGSGAGTSVGSGRTGRSGGSCSGSSFGSIASIARARRVAERSSERSIIWYTELFGLAQKGRGPTFIKRRFIFNSS